MNEYRDMYVLENVMYDRFLPFGSYVSNQSAAETSNRQNIWCSEGAKQFQHKKKCKKMARKSRKLHRK